MRFFVFYCSCLDQVKKLWDLELNKYWQLLCPIWEEFYVPDPLNFVLKGIYRGAGASMANLLLLVCSSAADMAVFKMHYFTLFIRVILIEVFYFNSGSISLSSS